MNNIIIFTSKINDIMFWYWFKDKQIFVNVCQNEFLYSKCPSYNLARYKNKSIVQIIY